MTPQVCMFSMENDSFELEENCIEFQEICTTLKDHAFFSPWGIFFKTSKSNGFTSEVSEFIVDDDDNNVRDFKMDFSFTDNVSFYVPSDVSKKNNLVSPDAHIDQKKICRLKESLTSAQDDSPIECLKDFDIFFTIPSVKIPLLFEMLNFEVLNDAAFNLILNAFLHFKDQISIATAIALAHHAIFPLIFDKKNSSRFLLTTILKFAEAYPKAAVDEILLPYSKKEISDDLQSEIVYQIAKTNLPNEYVSYSIKHILAHTLPIDNSFVLLQFLIERKVHHDSGLYDLLLQKLLHWSSQCNKNVKFTKLLTSILSSCGNELTEHQVLLFDEVVKSNKTIIKKAAENLLKRLKQENF